MRTIALLFVLCLPITAAKAETPQLTFISEYVRELGENESSRARAEKELAESGADKMPAIIRNSTRIMLELRAQIAMLNGMTLNPPFAELPGQIAQFYAEEMNVYNQLMAGAVAMASGPKPGVDYGALAAEAPKLTGTLEYLQKSLFEATPLIFATLIDSKPDRNGKMSRLIITRAERNMLVKSLQIEFGSKMEQKDQSWIVSSATVLRDYLSKKGYACADEPQPPAATLPPT
jgi:hypothetical protein